MLICDMQQAGQDFGTSHRDWLANLVANMQTPHILIVEDELVTRNTLKSIFEAGRLLMYLKRPMARKCIRSLSENDINLVIMDINLPG